MFGQQSFNDTRIGTDGMADNGKTGRSTNGDGIADLLAKYRKRVKRAFRIRPAPDATGTAVANPRVTEDEGAQAPHPGSQTSKGENR